MKKSLRRKLIMSAVAVGVAAAGTTASTYAWFVSSTEVSSTVSGTVESSGASLFISNDGVSYGTKAVKPTADFSKLKMAPLQMKATNHTLSSLDDGEATKNEDYIFQFKILILLKIIIVLNYQLLQLIMIFKRLKLMRRKLQLQKMVHIQQSVRGHLCGIMF